MRGAGKDRVIASLLSAPRLSGRALIVVLPDLILRCDDDKAYKLYVTDALKLIGGINLRYAEIIDRTAPTEKLEPEEIIKRLIESGAITLKEGGEEHQRI